MKLTTFSNTYSLDRLKRDMNTAIRDWDWSRGVYGHALSLPTKKDLHPSGQNHKNNLPYANVLKKCPYFREIFYSFKCGKSSFRLLRRGPQSSYGWHTDEDKGERIIRMQIPIITNNQSYLIVTDYNKHREIKGPYKEFIDKKNLKEFKKYNKGHYKSYRLKPGTLNFFNTNKLHTLINSGETQRITLLMDFVANDWFLNKYPQVKKELSKAGLISKLFKPLFSYV